MAAAGGSTVCVTGAAGYIGSWLVMRLLERGYTVRATVRYPENKNKVKHLLDLPNASTKLTLWKADLVDEGSYDEPIDGCDGVFHVATPMESTSSDHEVKAKPINAKIQMTKSQVIKLAVDGVVNILKSCLKAGTVRRVVYTSSVGTVCMQPQPKLLFDEDDWSDVDFLRATQQPGSKYFISKTLAEKTAHQFAEHHNLDLVSVLPSLVNGPFLTSTLPGSAQVAMCLIIKNQTPYYYLLNPCFLVHVDDVCMAHICVFEHPEAQGRYLCSSQELTLSDLSSRLKDRCPEYDIPTEFQGIDVAPHPIRFSREKLTDLGFEFKCSLEDIYDGAIQSCIDKGILAAPNND